MATDRQPILMVAGRMTAPRVQWLREDLTTDWALRTWTEDEPFAAFADQVRDATAVVAGRIPGDWPALPKLRLYQIPFTGHDWIDGNMLPSGCVVCNTFEHEIAVAEYVLGAVLQWEIGLAAADRRFRLEGWDYSVPGTGPNHGELFGKTMGIVGYGHIGREVARRADAFGMRCIAIGREAGPPPAPLAWLGDAAMLERLLAESDYVLLAVPLTDATRGLIDAAGLVRMKSDAVIINVARGPVIDEDALYDALASRRIGGAIIDVWYGYPSPEAPDRPPSRHPFQDLENVIMTPHFSAHTGPTRRRRWKFVAANLDRLARGEALRNVCLQVP